MVGEKNVSGLLKENTDKYNKMMEKWVHVLPKGQKWLQTFTGRITTFALHCQSIDHSLQKECTEPFGLWDQQLTYTVYIESSLC